MSTPDSALQRVLGILVAQHGEPWRDVKAHQLAVQWPSLAAALGDLMAAHELPLPAPLRRAAQVARNEERITFLAGPPSVDADYPTKTGSYGYECLVDKCIAVGVFSTPGDAERWQERHVADTRHTSYTKFGDWS